MAEGGDQTSNTISSNDVNEQFLATLIEMGIQQDIARKALKRINNRSLEDALAIIFNESSPSNNEQQAAQNIVETDEDVTTYKMLFVINGSLQMNSGKIATSVADSAIDLYQNLISKCSRSLTYWQEYGETKIVVRGKSTEELIDIESRAKNNPSIFTSMNQEMTCIALFGTNKQLNPITGHLRLMQDCLNCHGK